MVALNQRIDSLAALTDVIFDPDRYPDFSLLSFLVV
jgi:hypothetical protein